MIYVWYLKFFLSSFLFYCLIFVSKCSFFSHKLFLGPFEKYSHYFHKFIFLSNCRTNVWVGVNLFSLIQREIKINENHDWRPEVIFYIFYNNTYKWLTQTLKKISVDTKKCDWLNLFENIIKDVIVSHKCVGQTLHCNCWENVMRNFEYVYKYFKRNIHRDIHKLFFSLKSKQIFMFRNFKKYAMYFCYKKKLINTKNTYQM